MSWNFDHTYSKLPEIFFRHQKPQTAPSPKMVIFNDDLAKFLGLNPNEIKNAPEIFAGSELPPGAKPLSQAYAGHQFGHFTKLGDGRAVLLGEQITPDGRRFDVQLKGSGPTPFSRRGDGFAALLPMLREYIISEAMFALGVPTTRSLAVVLTGRDVIRETVLQGAVLTRVASSHIRVGTFEYASAYGTPEDVRTLADYSIRRHFPEIENEPDKYVLLLRKVADLQASLIASWQHVGFIHGVMNTDNMSVSGETIDYGPCAFMDNFNPDTVFSSIDTGGRYAYKNQPKIGAWNLCRFAESLLPLLHNNIKSPIEIAENEIDRYWERYNEYWLNGMRAKLGILSESANVSLIDELLNLMAEHKLDYTNTFRKLSLSTSNVLANSPKFSEWQQKWQARMPDTELMKKHNPVIIPRNHHVEEALAAAENGDFSVMHSLLEALSRPYDDSEKYAQPPQQTNCTYQTFCGT
ncbi:MAG: YdiU family protein [Defluviitaleaceae bacterium]|nr:YdiU family protein [Defluviitaleaceae bacterium]